MISPKNERGFKKMKRLLEVLSVLFLVVFISACSSSQETTQQGQNNKGTDNEQQANSSEPVELQLAIEATGDIPQEFQKQIDRFNEKNENITVKIRTFSGGDSYNQALMGQVAGGVAPDIFLLDGGQRTQTFANAKAILALDDLVANSDLDLNNFQESLVNAFKVDEKLYGIPKDYNTTALFYHKDLLEEKGIEPPTTWDELKDSAMKLTTEDQFGFGMNPQINYFLPFVESAGAKIIEENGVDKEALKFQEHQEGLQFMVDMFTKDKSAASPQMVGAGWDGEMFANKKVAMLYGGSWIPGVLKEDANVGAVPLPIKENKASMLYTAGWAVSSKSKNPVAAMKLISFLSSDEELVKGNQVGLIGLPPTKSAMNKLIEVKKDDPFLQVYSQVVEYGTPFGWIDPKFVDEYNKKMEVLMYKPGEKTVEQVVNELAK
jgi:multiple sugar transport system substrate-binding protein